MDSKANTRKNLSNLTRIKLKALIITHDESSFNLRFKLKKNCLKIKFFNSSLLNRINKDEKKNKY
ncbi:hypothetical protein BpHYR1_052249 [Brachionus plicatilis]|uniref:Uncharacterized protein n=1 Tax=Brachionus plicatilis TaxID=10195 RepID=A0A3M7TAW9_BRAPC|nr:hypothetical protein BpHYR1_052249 [Brachionus plicatilis]